MIALKVVAMLALCLIATTFTATAHAAPAKRVCLTYTVPDTDAGWNKSQRLQRRGWYGIAGDGAERLYSPGCKTRTTWKRTA